MQVVEDKKKQVVRWGVERRMEFIEFRLYWEGYINRADLMSFFGISMPQASADLAYYQKLAPNNIDYDGSAKRYIAGKGFKPIFLPPDSETYLRQLSSLTLGLIDKENCFARWIPNFDIVPTLQRRVEPNILFSILSAIRTRRSVNIEYQSMTNSQPTQRRISPHALGFDNFRWHIRAYCHSRKEFRDFIFSRILSLKEDDPSEIDTSCDREWHEYVTVRIGPNAGFEDNKRKAIELDYGMENGEITIKIRGALFFYLSQRLGFNKNGRSLSPDTQQIVFLNWDEIVALLSQLKERSNLN